MYYDHVKNIADRIQSVVAKMPKGKGYDPLLDDDLMGQVLENETHVYALDNGWLLNNELNLSAAQMIAGHSVFIEESVNFRYRKDSFRDMAWGALLKDVLVKVEQSLPFFLENYNPCCRER